MPHTEIRTEADTIQARRFAWIAAIVCGLVSFLPYLYGVLLQPVGQTYLGYQYNTDDHMVYSAWMRQAADGQFFFDNRFAVDPQPGLTVHLYFFVLGLFSKLFGLALTAALAKAFFAGAFVLLMHRLLMRLTLSNFLIKLSIAITAFGGGLGFFFWHRFGEAIVAMDLGKLGEIMLQRLPIDVWQPEAFVFPSLLTNSLFMVSLCLIVGIFECVLAARDSWRPVAFGFVWMTILMNIHSYDVLLVTLVLVGFLAASVATKTATTVWVGRVAVMGLGAVGPALWFMHVLKNDPVFQARAATDTATPNFRAVVVGLAILVALSLIGMVRGIHVEGSRSPGRIIGASILGVGVLILFALAGSHTTGYWLDQVPWVILFVGAVLAAALIADDNPAWNLFVAWAIVGLVAIYFPAAFQRKLAMGLSVPWAVLASVGIWQVSMKMERGTRNLVATFVILLVGASSLRWFLREGEYIRNDVSRTTVHSVFLTEDAQRILDHLDQAPGRKVVLAMPGIPSPVYVEERPVPDQFQSPYLPDLNAVASGLTGAYTYAGHWSESPDYNKRREETSRFFLPQTTTEQRLELIQRVGVTHIIAPVQEAFPELQFADLTGLGTVVVDGPKFRLIQVSSG